MADYGRMVRATSPRLFCSVIAAWARFAIGTGRERGIAGARSLPLDIYPHSRDVDMREWGYCIHALTKNERPWELRG